MAMKASAHSEPCGALCSISGQPSAAEFLLADANDKHRTSPRVNLNARVVAPARAARDVTVVQGNCPLVSLVSGESPSLPCRK